MQLKIWRGRPTKINRLEPKSDQMHMKKTQTIEQSSNLDECVVEKSITQVT